MKKYLFDTNAISTILFGSAPEKWLRHWKDVKEGRGTLILFEPLISEIFYRNTPKLGKKACKDKILWLKSLPRAEIHQLGDNEAIDAGNIKIDFAKNNLSLVDCFLLSVGKRYSCKIFTTDHSVRDVARELRINVDYLPFKYSQKLI